MKAGFGHPQGSMRGYERVRPGILHIVLRSQITPDILYRRVDSDSLDTSKETPMTDPAVQNGDTRSATLRCAFCLKLNRIDVSRAEDRPKCGECGRPFLLDRPVKIAGEDLERVVADAEVPVLIDFYADWCGPCKMMAPILDDFASDHSGGLLVGKLDTDAAPAVSAKYGIRGIPTLILFSGGAEVARQTGAVARSGLDELVSAL
jgi:thioredoxin 2